jgi:hypothetical protein
LERNIQDAQEHGIDDETIQHDLIPFLRQVSKFMATDGEDLRGALPILSTKLMLDYHANLFFNLNALWTRLDEQERQKFRANASPLFLNQVVPDASAAYFLSTLPQQIPSFSNPAIAIIFSESLRGVNGFLSMLLGRPPTHKEVLVPLWIDLQEVMIQNEEIAKDMNSAIKYLGEIMQVTEEIMGVTYEDANQSFNSQTERE